MGKIFGIGLSRSGTSSLTQALTILDYTAIHSPTSLDKIRRHDAATDTTVADNFERLDGFFPGSRFVHTLRAKEPWLASCERFWLLMQPRFDGSFLLTELHKQLYGTPTFDRNAFAAAYDRHLERVQRFFESRPDDLLRLSFDTHDDMWTPLCRFLGRPVPAQDFPRSHGMTLIETCIARLMAHFGDVAVVAKLANTSSAFIETVRASAGDAAPISPEGSMLVQDLIVRTCKRVGSTAKTARILGVPRASVKSAVLGHRGPMAWHQRAKAWIR